MEETELIYDKSPLYKRWFGTIIDIFIMVFLGLALYGLTSFVTTKVPTYDSIVQEREERKEESGLYSQEGELLSFYYKDSDVPVNEKKEKLSSALEHFFHDFLKNEEMTRQYEQAKVNALDDSGNHIFGTNEEGAIIELNYSPQIFVDFYCDEIDNLALSALATDDVYNRASRIITIVSLVELFLCMAIGYGFSFLIMPLFLKRGRKTIGMYIFKISLIGEDALNVRGKRLLARELLSFFVYYCLGIVTVFIPILVSLTMMHLSKNSQSFLDYMTGTYVVDTARHDVYLDYAEYEKRMGMRDIRLDSKDVRLTNRKRP